MKRDFVVAVDVGTASLRVGVLDRTGRILSCDERPISMNRPRPDHAEHDSTEIWSGVCDAVRAAVAASGIAPETVAAIGFDATCSLVALTADGAPVTVSTGGEDRWDTIAWLDHRAKAEAERCSATRHLAVTRAGGALSPEMAIPKLAWLKANLPESWHRAGLLFDLADFLTWKATGSTARSVCTLGCKWAYLADRAEPWPQDFFEQSGVPDLVAKAGLPRKASPVGADLGALTGEAAEALGLSTACRVAAGLIDAHAGALAALGSFDGADLSGRAALVAGTSSCVTLMSDALHPIPGVWGPYPGAARPGLRLAEAGQSLSGGLLDHVIRIASGGLEPGIATHERICARIAELREVEGADLAPRLHVLADFHGNRSPFADADALGVISGLPADASFDALCRLYFRTAVGIALGVRQIVENFAAHGRAIETLHLVGGQGRSSLMPQLYADATGLEVFVSGSANAMLLGTAMSAAVAAGWHSQVADACRAMRQSERSVAPDPARKAAFERDLRILARMQDHRAEIEALVGSPSA